MGDVQGKHQDDGDNRAVTLDKRDVHRPPDRVAMHRDAIPSYYVPPAPSLAAVSTDGTASSERQAPVVDPSVLGRRAGERRRAQDNAASGLSDGPSQSRRKSRVTQPIDVKVPERGTLRLPRPQGAENRVPPLAEAIKRKANTTDKDLLVFDEVESVRKKRTDGSSSDRSSPESNNSAKMSVASGRSGSSSSDGGDSLGPGRWRQRWCVDRVGHEQGQIRCIRDLCMLRSGSIVVTEPKNVRLQMFAKTGKSLAVLGPDTDDPRSARSFGNPLAFRNMNPTGIVETVFDNLVAVTDLNRVLYIEAMPNGMLDGEIFLKGKTELRGIATTFSSRIIVTEVGSQASVGLYETNGKFVREYKGNFRKPCYVANDQIYDVTAVSDGEQGLVFLYDSSGNHLTKFGLPKDSKGRSSAGHLVYPSGLCWTSRGRLLVADEVQKKVVAFDLRNFTAETLLSADDGLHRPVAIAADFRDTRNRIYVAEELYDFGVNKYYLKMFEERLTNSC